MAEPVDYRIGRISDIRLPEGANFSADFTFTGVTLTGYEATLTARRGSNGGRVPFTWSKSGLTVGASAISFDISPAGTDDAGKAFSTVSAKGSTDYALTIRQSGGGAIVMRLQGTVQWLEEVGDFDAGTAASNQIAVAVSGATATVTVTNAGHAPVTVVDSSSVDLTLTGQQITASAIFGTTAGTVCQGNDSRLSDARTPTSHTHAIGDITNLQTALDGKVSAIGATAADVLSVASGQITADDPGADRLIFWDDSENKLAHLTAGSGLTISGTTISATGGGGGSGDVVGPSFSGDNQLVRFDGSTGKLIQASGITVSDDVKIEGVERITGLTNGGGGGWLEIKGGANFQDDTVEPAVTYTGGASGSVICNGGDAAVGVNGAVGGSFYSYATGANAGGNFYAQGGGNGAGGEVNTSDGGGSINTRGTGIIELGQTGTRTTLEGTATTDRAIDFPDEAGTLIVGPVTAAKMSAGAAADGYVLTSDGAGNVAWQAQSGGVSTGDKGDITVSNGGNTWTIDDGAVTADKIPNNGIGLGKLQGINTDSLVGRDDAGAGAITTISVGGGIEFTGSNGIQTSALTGDVTKTAGGTSTTIANDAVTYAKLQNVSATSRVLGRKSSGSGDAEECTLSEILDFVGSAAQGDILYRGASGWERLGAGTSGRFLRTNGAASNPSWNPVPVETAVITSNYTDSTGAVGNVTGMSFSLAANERVTAILSGFWNTQTTNSGFRYDFTGPSSPTYVLYNAAHGISQTAFRSGDGATAFSTAFLETSGNSGLYLPITIYIHVVNGATPGTVQLRMGGETNGVTFTLYQGFTMQLFRF